MQKNLADILKSKGIEMEQWGEDRIRIRDSDRIVILAPLNSYSASRADQINNEIMEMINQRRMEAEENKVEKYGQYTMRQILWDVYILYVLTDKEKFVDEEQVYMLQRDKKYSKKYLIQEDNVEKAAETIFRLLYPEHYIDSVIAKIQYKFTDGDNCKRICDAENEGKRFVENFQIRTCQDILDFLNKINADEYGE